MIRELTELAERNRKTERSAGNIVHNAIKKEKVNFYLFIDEDGKFLNFQRLNEPRLSDCEALSSKKGKARLLVDKLEEALGLDFFDSSARDRNELYLNKLENFRQIEQLEPIFKFFNEAHGLESAKAAILNEIKSDIQKEIDEINKSDKKNKKPVEVAASEKVEKKYEGNIAFSIGEKLVNEDENVISAIIDKYEESQSSFTKKVCSVCGKEKYPVEDIPHGMLSNVPEGLNGRGALISFNENAFESYNLKGNLNSQICNNCFPAYTEALNWLLAPSGTIKDIKGKDKVFFNNRFNFGKDTATVFWTKKETTFNVKKVLESKSAADVKTVLESMDKGRVSSVNANDFYSITLSGASARIMIRDFIHTSLESVQENLKQWFEDIDIGRTNPLGESQYSPLWLIAETTRRPNDSKRKDVTPSRIHVLLWKAAIQGYPLPLWILHAVINRIRMDSYKISDKKENSQNQENNKKSKKGSSDKTEPGSLSLGQVFSPARIALIQIVLIRLRKGERNMKELDSVSTDRAYNCGRIFAVLAKIQYHAAKRDLNVGIVNKHYSAASATPSSTFGRLFKNSRNHLDKIGNDNMGLAINLEKQLSDLMLKIGNAFPQVLSLEGQGRFALGFYQQRNLDFKKGEIGDETVSEVEENLPDDSDE